MKRKPLSDPEDYQNKRLMTERMATDMGTLRINELGSPQSFKYQALTARNEAPSFSSTSSSSFPHINTSTTANSTPFNAYFVSQPPLSATTFQFQNTCQTHPQFLSDQFPEPLISLKKEKKEDKSKAITLYQPQSPFNLPPEPSKFKMNLPKPAIIIDHPYLHPPKEDLSRALILYSSPSVIIRKSLESEERNAGKFAEKKTGRVDPEVEMADAQPDSMEIES